MATEYFKERLTEHERKLVAAFPHQLPEKEFKERSDILNREVKRDVFWGFFDNGAWPAVKRTIYRILIHPFLRKP